MRWLVIYPMDSAIQRLSNRGLSNRKQSISQLQVQVKGTLLANLQSSSFYKSGQAGVVCEISKQRRF